MSEVVFQAERRRLTLHCGCITSSHLDTCSWRGEAFSPYLVFLCACYLYCRHECTAFCTSGSVNMMMWNLWNLHVFHFLFNTNNAKAGDGSFSACVLSLSEAESRCFSNSLTAGADGRMSVPTLECVWHVTGHLRQRSSRRQIVCWLSQKQNKTKKKHGWIFALLDSWKLKFSLSPVCLQPCRQTT